MSEAVEITISLIFHIAAMDTFTNLFHSIENVRRRTLQINNALYLNHTNFHEVGQYASHETYATTPKLT